jgi:hypothetical protein
VYILCDGRALRVNAQLIFPAQPAAAQLPLADARVAVRLGGQEAALTAGANGFAGEARLAAGDHALAATASVPGYFHFQQNGSVRTVDCPARVVTLVAKPKGTLGDASQPWRALLTELMTAPPLELYPLIEGQRASAAELKATELSVDLGELNADVLRTDSGWEINPRLKWGSPAFTPTGTFPIAVDLKTSQPDDVKKLPQALSLQIDDPGFLERFGPLLSKLLALLLLLVYLFGVWRKPRLAPGSTVHFETANGRKGKAFRPQGAGASLARWLLPFVAERMRCEEVSFHATPDRRLKVPAGLVNDSWAKNGQPVQRGQPVLLRSGDVLTTGQGPGRKTYTVKAT